MAKTSRRPATEISIPNQLIEGRIRLVRDQKVMLDEDLAELYGVSTKRLNEQVTRNINRFPGDFMFPLSRDEALDLRSQNATLKRSRGQHRKYAPRAFTEHGILDALQRSAQRVGGAGEHRDHESIRAFSLVELATGQVELTRKLNALEEKYDVQFKVVFDAMRALMDSAGKPRRRIGLKSEK
jgi:hypothetical protein